MTENSYKKNFNWKQFIKVSGSIFLIFLGASIGVFSNRSVPQLIIAFALVSIGIALIATD